MSRVKRGFFVEVTGKNEWIEVGLLGMVDRVRPPDSAGLSVLVVFNDIEEYWLKEEDIAEVGEVHFTSLYGERR